MALSLTRHGAGLQHLGSLKVPKDLSVEKKIQPLTVLIMDRSSSMGRFARMVGNRILPQVMLNLGLQSQDEIILITFDSQIESKRLTVEALTTAEVQARGSTNMVGIFNELEKYLTPEVPQVRLLVISDGQVWDKNAVIPRAQQMANKWKETHEFSVRGIRLFTDEAYQPDTTALASVLQLNTREAGSLLDIPADEIWKQIQAEEQYTPSKKGTDPEVTIYERCADLVTQQIMEMYLGEEFGHGMFQLTASTPVLKRFPWSEAEKTLYLLPGDNTFWMTAEIPEELTLAGHPVEIQLGAPMTSDNMGILMAQKIDYFMQQLKLLKILNTPQAQEEIHRIVAYFQELEKNLAPPEDLAPLLAKGDLKGRVAYFKKKLGQQLKSVTTAMEMIANDQKVGTLNLAQQADYLREVDLTKTGRGLAARAVKSGLEFDQVVRKEIGEMATHFHELAEIDDSEHEVSFYSQGTTLDGIRELILLSQDHTTFQQLGASELLQVFNLVGVPCQSKLGDYPDPMTWRVQKLLYGAHISVADLTLAYMMNQQHLTMPATKEEIHSVVPVYPDLRIQDFLQAYAPTMLDLSASIGMRRVLAEISQTYPYTLCGGVWKSMEDLAHDPTEAHIQVFCQFVRAYERSVGTNFDYLMPYLQDNQNPEKSYFMNHNGITNMLIPVLKLVREGKTQYWDRILRALYTYEIYQVGRRICKQRPDEMHYWQEVLDRLLGVDFEKYGTPMPELFTRPKPEHHTEVHLDQAYFEELKQEFWYLKYAIHMPQMLQAVCVDDPVAHLRRIPKPTPEEEKLQLNLEYPLEEFLLYNLVEAFLCRTKQSRIEKETNLPLRPDLGHREAGQAMVREYLTSRYEAEYQNRLRIQGGIEKKMLKDELVFRLAGADLETFQKLLTEGIQMHDQSFALTTMNSAGFTEFQEQIMNPEAPMEEREEKLFIWYSGTNRAGEKVWNGGNMLRVSQAPLEELCAQMHYEKLWEELKELYATKQCHIYRGGEEAKNRHGHSNDLPSYWAFGFPTLEAYREGVTPEQWTEYTKLHQGCCGVADLLFEEGLAVAPALI